MTPATPEGRLYDLLAAEAVTLGRRLTKDEYLAAFRAFFAKEFPGGKKPKRKPVSQMTDDEWIEHLEKEPTLAGVDVKRELGRAQFWCNENARKCSRRFFVNWLNKAERSLGVDGAGRSSRPRISADINVEPAGWFAVAVRLYGQYAADQFKATGWKGIDPHYRKEMVKALL